MAKRKKIYINIDESRKFLSEVYGLKSKLINHYHLKVYHEEYRGVFNWYYTTGTIVLQLKDKNGDVYQRNIGTATTVEDFALEIQKKVQKDLKKGKNYWIKYKRPTWDNITNLLV